MSRRLSIASLVALASHAIVSCGHAQMTWSTPSAVLVEGSAIATDRTVSEIRSIAVNAAGGFATRVTASGSSPSVSGVFVWGTFDQALPHVLADISPGPIRGIVSTEETLSISLAGQNSGQVAFSSLRGVGLCSPMRISRPTGALDAGFVNGAMLVSEDRPVFEVPTTSRLRWVSRSGVTSDGQPHFQVGIIDDVSGATRCGVVLGNPLSWLIGSGDAVAGTGSVLVPDDPIRDFAIAADGTHWIASVRTHDSTGAERDVLLVDSAVVKISGEAVSQGSVCLASGAATGEVWDTLGKVGVSVGDGVPRNRFFSATTLVAEAASHVLVRNKRIIHRDGDSISGAQPTESWTLQGPPLSPAMNDSGDLVYLWRLAAPGLEVPTYGLFVNEVLVWRTHDATAIVNLGQAGAGTVTNVIGPSPLRITNRSAPGELQVYLIANLQPLPGYVGVPSDQRVEALLRVDVSGLPSPTCAADWNGVGGFSLQDLFDFLAAHLGGDGDFNDDGVTTVEDLFAYLAAYFAGCA